MKMWTRKKKITISVIIAIVVILVGGYLFGTHRVASTVPGHVYQYTRVSMEIISCTWRFLKILIKWS